VVHYACPRGGGRGSRPGGIAHARQPAGCTVVPQGLPFEGSAGRGEEGAPVGWAALVGGARAAASGGSRRGEEARAGQGELTSRRRASRSRRVDQSATGVGRHAAGELTSWRGGVGGVPGGMAAPSGRGCGGEDSGPAGRHGAGSRPPGRSLVGWDDGKGIYIGRHGVCTDIYIYLHKSAQRYILGVD
jgi:hypothetical protein